MFGWEGIVGTIIRSVFTLIITSLTSKSNKQKYQREEVWRILRWAIDKLKYQDIKQTFIVLRLLIIISKSKFILKQDKIFTKTIIDLIIKTYKSKSFG